MNTETARKVISKYEPLVVLCTYNILFTNVKCGCTAFGVHVNHLTDFKIIGGKAHQPFHVRQPEILHRKPVEHGVLPFQFAHPAVKLPAGVIAHCPCQPEPCKFRGIYQGLIVKNLLELPIQHFHVLVHFLHESVIAIGKESAKVRTDNGVHSLLIFTSGLVRLVEVSLERVPVIRCPFHRLHTLYHQTAAFDALVRKLSDGGIIANAIINEPKY